MSNNKLQNIFKDRPIDKEYLHKLNANQDKYVTLAQLTRLLCYKSRGGGNTVVTHLLNGKLMKPAINITCDGETYRFWRLADIINEIQKHKSVI